MRGDLWESWWQPACFLAKTLHQLTRVLRSDAIARRAFTRSAEFPLALARYTAAAISLCGQHPASALRRNADKIAQTATRSAGDLVAGAFPDPVLNPGHRLPRYSFTPAVSSHYGQSALCPPPVAPGSRYRMAGG